MNYLKKITILSLIFHLNSTHSMDFLRRMKLRFPAKSTANANKLKKQTTFSTPINDKNRDFNLIPKNKYFKYFLLGCATGTVGTGVYVTNQALKDYTTW